MTAFGVGAGTGALTAVNPALGAMVGGAASSATNNIIAQTGNGSGLGDVNWGQVGTQAFVGAAVGAATFGVSSAVSSTGITNKILDASGINNNVVRNIAGSTITGTISGAGAGLVQGVATGAITGDWRIGENLLKGSLYGAAAGAVYGGLTELGYQAQLKYGKNKVLNSSNTEAVAKGGNKAIGKLKTIGGEVSQPIDAGALGNRNGIGGVVVEVSRNGNVNVYYDINAPGYQPINSHVNYQNPYLYDQVFKSLTLTRFRFL